MFFRRGRLWVLSDANCAQCRLAGRQGAKERGGLIRYGSGQRGIVWDTGQLDEKIEIRTGGLCE